MSEEYLLFPIGHPHRDLCPIHNTLVVLQVGVWGPFYRCTVRDCTVTGSAHGDGRPTGRLATKDIAQKRVYVHVIANYLKQTKYWIDDDLYTWIKQIQGPYKPFHIGDMFDKDLKNIAREMQKEMKR